MFKKTSLVLILLLIGAMVYAGDNRISPQNPHVPFDVNEVIKKVNRHNSQTKFSIPNRESDEFLIDTSIVYFATQNDQYWPSVAFDGTNYLVVWEDRRSNDGYDFDIYGVLVNQNGVVLNPAGIIVSNDPADQGSPSVAFDGTNYFVVWLDDRNGVMNYDIYGARVNQAGIVIDTNGIAISTVPGDQTHPSVAFDRTNYFVGWLDNRSINYVEIYGARVNQDGVVLDPNGIYLSNSSYWQSSFAIAFDETNYLVVWADYRSGSNFDIYGARMNQAGVILDTNGIPISTVPGDKYSISIAFDGTNYLVVWQDKRNSNNFDIYGARINQAGVVLDPNGIAISATTYQEISPSVAFAGTNYLVVWMDGRSGDYDIYGARVNQSGTVLDPNGIAMSTELDAQCCPSIAFDGTNYFVVWHDYRNGGYTDIYGARVNQNCAILDTNGILISLAVNDQYSPSVAFDGTNYLVVWDNYSDDNPNSDIYGIRVNQNGIVLDTNIIAISTVAGSQLSPSITFDGINYFIGLDR
jgi:hypothetical protein